MTAGWGGSSLPIQFRFGGLGVALIAAMVVGLSTVGLTVSLAEHRGVAEIISWLVMSVVFAASFFALFHGRLRWLKKLARSRTKAPDDVYFFSNGSLADNPDDVDQLLSSAFALGPGFVQLDPTSMRVWSGRDGRLRYEASPQEVEAVERTRVWRSRIFVAQIRIRFATGAQAIVTPAHPGWHNLLGCSTREIDHTVHVIQTRLQVATKDA